MNTSEQINELAKALAAAQGEIEPAIKDTANPFFKSTYADFHAVREACREPLSKHGIAMVQGLSTHDGAVHVTTRLIHLSGQWIESVASSVPKDFSPQGVGSAATYLRRYSLSAMVGISQHDDDGNEASGRTHEPHAPVRQAPGPVLAMKPAAATPAPSKATIPAVKPSATPNWKISDQERRDLLANATLQGYDPVSLNAVIQTRYGVADSKAMTQENYTDLLGYIKTYKYGNA